MLEIQFLQIRQAMSHCTARPDICPCMAQGTCEKHFLYLCVKTAIKINVLCALNKSSVCLLYMHKETNMRANRQTDKQEYEHTGAACAFLFARARITHTPPVARCCCA